MLMHRLTISGKQLDLAADQYAERFSHIFCETGHRLTFQTLKERVLRSSNLLHCLVGPCLGWTRVNLFA